MRPAAAGIEVPQNTWDLIIMCWWGLCCFRFFVCLFVFREGFTAQGLRQAWLGRAHPQSMGIWAWWKQIRQRVSELTELVSADSLMFMPRGGRAWDNDVCYLLSSWSGLPVIPGSLDHALRWVYNFLSCLPTGRYFSNCYFHAVSLLAVCCAVFLRVGTQLPKPCRLS